MIESEETRNCKCCGKILRESYPKCFSDDGDWVCGDCAFISGTISEKEYLNTFWYFFDFDDKWVVVDDGKITVGFGRKKDSARNRSSSAYQKWRAEVFKRDNFTCQICQKVGGELNAHHIRPYANYKDLRFDVDNGITLCRECHKLVHHNKDKNYLKGD